MLLGCATPAPVKMHVIQSDDGLAEISVPEHWRTRPNLGRNADIRLADASGNNYLLVTSYQPGEADPMSLEEFAERLTSAIRDNVGNGKMSTARRLTINGMPAIEHELDVNLDGTGLVYLSTMADGRRARYHLIGWAAADADVGELRRVMSAFRESDIQRAALSRQNLDFNWPSKMTSKVSFHRKSSKRGETFEIRGEAVSSTRPEGADQLLISSRVTSVKMSRGDKSSGKDDGKDAYLQQVLEVATTNIPDYVVSRDGEFVRIDNLAGYHARVQDAIINRLLGDSQAVAMARQLVTSLLTEQSLAVAAQEEWNNVVENWTGGSYAVGKKYQYTVPYQAPAMENRTFPMVVTQELAARVPCHSGAAAKACVRLIQTSRVSGPEFTKATGEFVRNTVGKGVSVSDMEIVKTVEMVTDPKTMLPYRTNEKEVRRVTVNADGKANTSEDIKESSTTYVY